MSAWITKEWTEDGKRRRETVAAGTKGVKACERFVVEWLTRRADAAGRRSKVCGRPAKQLADYFCKQLNSEIVLGQYHDRSRRTWKGCREKFERDVFPTMRSEESVRDIKATLDRFQDIMAPKDLADVTTALIDDFKSRRCQQKTRAKKPVAHTTVNKDLRNLKRFFRKADEWDLIDKLPRFGMLDETETIKPTYTEDEFVAMYQHSDAATLPHISNGCPRSLWWQTLLVMFWETGMRRREMLYVEWCNINFQRRSLIVEPKNTKSKRLKQYTFGELGTDHLARLAEFGTAGYVFEWRHELARLNDSLGEIQQAAGIDQKRANFKFHAFRRTVGEMTAETHGLTAAQYKLAHSNSGVTAKHYARAAMRKLAEKSAMPVPQRLKVVGCAG